SRNRFCAITDRSFPERRWASSIRSHSSSEGAIGFSAITCTPASSAWTLSSQCVPGGVAIETRSRCSEASIVVASSYTRAPSRANSARAVSALPGSMSARATTCTSSGNWRYACRCAREMFPVPMMPIESMVSVLPGRSGGSGLGRGGLRGRLRGGELGERDRLGAGHGARDLEAGAAVGGLEHRVHHLEHVLAQLAAGPQLPAAHGHVLQADAAPRTHVAAADGQSLPALTGQPTHRHLAVEMVRIGDRESALGPVDLDRMRRGG